MEKHFILFVMCLLVHVTYIMAGKNKQKSTFAEAVPKCGTNEFYLEHGKLSPCEKTCANPELVCVRTKIGWKGCHCLPDHVRDKSGNCVLLKDCPTAVGDCGTNEVYSKFGEGCTSCDATCRVETGACVRVCVEGCYCKFHHVRNAKGICIPLKKCSKS